MIINNQLNPLNLVPSNLRLWLDSSDSSTITKGYSTFSTATCSGTLGASTLTASATITGYLQVGMKIRVNSTDIYTITSASGTTIGVTPNLTATYAAGTLIELDYITAFNDKSGFGFNFSTPNIGTNPIYMESARNGLPMAYFNGVASCLISPNSQITASGDGVTIFVVANSYRASGDAFILDCGFYGNTGFTLGFTNSTMAAKSPTSYGGTLTSKTYSPALSSSNFSLCRYEFKFGVSQTVYLNGVALQTDAITTSVFSSTTLAVGSGRSSGSANAFTLGAQAKTTLDSSRFFYGNIGEFLMWNKVLTTAEAKQVQTYLANKWRLSVTI